MAGYTDVVLFRRLLGQARPYWPHVAALFLLSLLASPISLLTPLPLKIAVDSVIGSHPLPPFIAPFVPEAIARSAAGLLVLAVGLVLAVALLSQLQGLGSTLLRAWVQERLVLDFRARLFHHVQRISLAYHDTRGTADSTYRIQRDVLAVQHVLTEGFIPFVSATVTFVAMIYVMARIDWSLALIALAVSPGPVVIARVFRRRLRRQWREVKKLESAAQSVVQEVLGALRIVKAFGQEAREEQRFLGRSGDGMRARIHCGGTPDRDRPRPVRRAHPGRAAHGDGLPRPALSAAQDHGPEGREPAAPSGQRRARLLPARRAAGCRRATGCAATRARWRCHRLPQRLVRLRR
ncbi:MAG: hypothetical protein AUI36_16125 [Cyanobacteria bacterium 13_1_40CM_2_61_4]|nr:MAG: hypothetical protein AUI36_16125 [Cyanobacteria bacterium 13_1_40CM_2_61_4]